MTIKQAIKILLNMVQGYATFSQRIALGKAIQALKMSTQKKGKWIYPSQDPEIVNKEFFSDCSVCGFAIMNEYKYCPNCGTKMMRDD